LERTRNGQEALLVVVVVVEFVDDLTIKGQGVVVVVVVVDVVVFMVLTVE
jgi:hypothetical protein